MPETISPPLARWAVHSVARLLGVFAVAKGGLIVLTGGDRWTSPVYDTARSVPGAHLTWGWSLLVVGTIALIATFTYHYFVVAVCLALAGVWSMFFAIAYFLSVINIPGSAMDPFSTQLFITLMCLTVAAIYRSAHKDRQR
jgi:hypothetical protein